MSTLQNSPQSVETPPPKPAITPEGSIGLYWLIGFVLLLLSSAAFTAIASDVAGNESIVRFDMAIENAIHGSVSPTLVQGMFMASIAGSQLLIVLVVLLGIFFAVRHRGRDLVLLVVAIGGEELVNVLIKNAFDRARPVFSDPITLATGFSFPSGHAMASMVFYGLIAYFLMRHSKPLLERVLIVLTTALIVTIIGFSRIYLGVHYPSDVLGGYCAGLAWLVFTITGLGLYHHWRLRRHQRHQTVPDVPIRP